MTVPAEPDLSGRLLHLTVIRTMAAKPELLFRAWAEQFDRWFDALGSVLMRGEVDSPFYFETHFEGERHPLRAIPYRPPQPPKPLPMKCRLCDWNFGPCRKDVSEDAPGAWSVYHFPSHSKLSVFHEAYNGRRLEMSSKDRARCGKDIPIHSPSCSGDGKPIFVLNRVPGLRTSVGARRMKLMVWSGCRWHLKSEVISNGQRGEFGCIGEICRGRE